MDSMQLGFHLLEIECQAGRGWRGGGDWSKRVRSKHRNVAEAEAQGARGHDEAAGATRASSEQVTWRAARS